MKWLKIDNFIFNRWQGTVMVILVFVIASVFGVNQYRYGWSDQTITIPFIKFFLNPELFSGDYLLTQIPYYYTFLWFGLAVIIKYLHLSTPVIFFITYFLLVVALYSAIYLIAREIFKKKEVAFLSLFFLLFANTTLAGANILDDMLVTRTAVLPFLLFALYFFLKEKYFITYLLLGIGFLIHPLTALYVFAMIFVASIVNIKKIGAKKLFSAGGFFLITILPLIVWKTVYSPQSFGLLHVDASWLELLRLRSSHHIFPFSWNLDIFLKAVLTAVLFFFSFRRVPFGSRKRATSMFVVAIATMMIIGIIFTEIWPASFALELQFLRSWQFFVYLTIIYFSNYFVNQLEEGKKILPWLLLVIGSIAFFYNTSEKRLTDYSLFIYAGFIGGFILLFLFLKFLKRKELLLKGFIYFIVCFSLAVGGVAYAMQKNFTIYNAQDKLWLDVQYWANKNTSSTAMFIVPPSIEGFRVESERTIYADWKDGTLLNFNPQFGTEWLRRMKKLGYKKGDRDSLERGYMSLAEKDFIGIIKEQSLDKGPWYVVMYKERGDLNLPIVYQNGKFIVYRTTK